jgi:hypothetical protein
MTTSARGWHTRKSSLINEKTSNLLATSCSSLITSGRLLDYITSFLLGFVENIGGSLLALCKNMFELSENSSKTARCAHIP